MDTIVSQGTTSEIMVENIVEGDAEVYTHIETEVNGQKQVFETTEPGKYEIKLESSPEITATTSSDFIEPSPTLIPSPDFTHLKRSGIFEKIRDYLALFLSRWF